MRSSLPDIAPRKHVSRGQPLDCTAVSAALEKIQSSPKRLHDVSNTMVFRSAIDIDAPFRPSRKEVQVMPVLGTIPTPAGPLNQRLPPFFYIPKPTFPVHTIQTTSIGYSTPPTSHYMPLPIRTPKLCHSELSIYICSIYYPTIHPDALRMQPLIRSIPCPIPQCQRMIAQTIEGIRAHLVSHHRILYTSFLTPGLPCMCGTVVQGGGEAVVYHIATRHCRYTPGETVGCVNCGWIGRELEFAFHLLRCPNLAHLRSSSLSALTGLGAYPSSAIKRTRELEAEDCSFDVNPPPEKRQKTQRFIANAESVVSSEIRAPLAARSMN